jgi:type IV secretory pathway VirB10-like protein
VLKLLSKRLCSFPYTEYSTMGRPKGALGKNSKKKVKDVNKPKRATSAYFFFLASCRKEAAKAGKPPTKIAEFTKDASEKWKALTPDKKKPFESAAAEDKKRYEQEMAIYKGKSVDPNKPKRPPTAYFVFLADFRIRMANKGIEHKELLKMAGEEWRSLTSEDKKPFEKKALEESKKYEASMVEYRRTGGGVSGAPAAKKARVEEEDDEEEDEEDEEEEEEDDDDDE